MKRGLALILSTVFLLSFVIAQEKSGMPMETKAAKTVTLKGYIVDQSCGKGMAKKDNPMQKAASHTRDCALEDACAAAGYGIFSNGKYYTFDKDGSAKAKESLEKDKREKAIAYEATGTLDGTVLTVASLKETKLEQPKGKPAAKPAEKPKEMQ